MKLLVSCPRGRTFDSFFDKENIALAESLGEVIWNPYGKNMTKSQAKKLIVDCDVYVTLWGAPKLDAELFRVANKIQAVVHLGNRVLPFLSESVWKSGIKVLTGSQYYIASAAEGTLSYVLAALRNIPEYSMRLKYQNEWKHSWDTNRGLIGKIVGIVNYNAVSANFIRLLLAFDVKILVYDNKKIPKTVQKESGFEQVELMDIFCRSDVITVHTPNYKNYFHLISFEHFQKMRDGALIVNTSVGGLVNDEALAYALMKGKIYAVIDVYEQAPINDSNYFHYFQNAMLMPQMGGPTYDVRKLVTRNLLQECADYVEKGKSSAHSITYAEAKKIEIPNMM